MEINLWQSQKNFKENQKTKKKKNLKIIRKKKNYIKKKKNFMKSTIINNKKNENNYIWYKFNIIIKKNNIFNT